jgi:hypothetical protein
VNWQQAVLLSACGGAVVELVTFWQNVEEWRAARKRVRAMAKESLPRSTSTSIPRPILLLS